MIPAIIQQAAATSATTQNWTDSSITGTDNIGMLFISSSATAVDTVTAAGKAHLGATDGSHDYAIGFALQDASTTPNATMRSVAASIVNLASGGTATWEAAKTASLTNGITETYSLATTSPPLITALSFAGSDFEIGTADVSFASTDTTKSITHNCTGTPTAFILLVDNGEAAINSGGAVFDTWGFYESAGGTAGGIGFTQTSGASPTVVSAEITSDLGHFITATTDQATFSLSGIGASTLSINRTAANATTATAVLVSMRAKVGTLVAQAGLGTTPTSMGAFTPVTGVAGAKQVLLTIATRLTTSGSIQASSDSAGSFCVGMACNNQGTIQQATTSATTKHGVTTSVAKSQTSINKAMAITDNTGAYQFTATVTSFNLDGSITMNCTASGGIASKFIYLAFGVVPVANFRKTLSGIGGRIGTRQLQS